MQLYRIVAFVIVVVTLALPAASAAKPSLLQRASHLTSAAQVRVTPTVRRSAVGTLLDYVIPNTDSNSIMYAVLQGPDGNEWFNDVGDAIIGKVSPGGVITEYPEPRPIFEEMVSAHGALWSTDRLQLYRIDMNGRFTAVPVPGQPLIFKLAVDSLGDVWFVGNSGRGGLVGHLHSDGTVTYAVNLNAGIEKLAFGTDRKPYFLVTNSGGPDYVGRLEADGSITTFALNGVRCDVLLASHGHVLAVGSDTTTGADSLQSRASHRTDRQRSCTKIGSLR